MWTIIASDNVILLDVSKFSNISKFLFDVIFCSSNFCITNATTSVLFVNHNAEVLPVLRKKIRVYFFFKNNKY